MVIAKYSAVTAMIVAALISGASFSPTRSLSTISARPSSTAWLVEAGEGGDPDQGALELADVALDLRGDELQDLRRRAHALLRRLLAQDRDAGLEVGRLDVADQAPLEAGAQPVLERVQLARATCRS